MNALLVAGLAIGVSLHARLARRRRRLPLVLVALVWLPAATFIQMTITYDRPWTFVQPLYLMVASAGLLYLIRLLTLNRLRSSTVAAVTLAVLIAALSAAGDVRSNNVDLTVSERALGAEAAMRMLSRSALDATFYCAHKCPIIQFYGKMYELNIDNHYREDKANGPVMIVESMLNAEMNVNRAVQQVGVPLDQYQAPHEVFSEGDTRVFRLEPIARAP